MLKPFASRGTASALLFSLSASILVGSVLAAPAASAADRTFALVGDLQSELGCSGDWQPDCAATELVATADPDVYAAEFDVPAGSYAYKVAVDDAWDEAYGLDGGSDNIPLVLPADATLRFLFDDVAHRVGIEVVSLRAGYTSEDDALIAAPVRQPGAGQQFYFVMTDRFANGDTANDEGGLTGDSLVTGFDPTDKGFYNGGDLAGLRDRLDYIEGLGTTAIWLTPSFKNEPVQGTGANASAGYHGYWVTDFTQIDPHLGTNAELQALISDAHARGIKVYFDIITNHTADVISYAENEYSYIDQATSPYRDADGNPFDPANYAGTGSFPALDPSVSFPYTPVIAPEDVDKKVPAWLNDPTLYHNRGDSTWSGESVTYGDFVGLDDIMTEHPTVVEGFVDVYQGWIDLGIDGFRIDTAKHVNFEFWEQWTDEVLTYARNNGKPDFFMFGEVYDADPVKLAPYIRDTDMSSVLDFTFQSAAVSYASGNSARGLSALYAGDDRYTTPYSSSTALPTFLGNHDMGRVGYFMRNTSDPLGRTELANELMFLGRGQPVVYYGDEQGFMGVNPGNDKSARQSLFASHVAEYTDQALLTGDTVGSQNRYDTSAPLYQQIADLASLREDYPALATGAQIERLATNGAGVYAFSRVDRDEKIEHLVALNNTGAAITLDLPSLTTNGSFTGVYGTTDVLPSNADGIVNVTVPALGAVVLRAGTQVTAPAEAAAITVTAPAAGAGVTGSIEVTAETDGAWRETSFAWRAVGSSEWHALGTAEDTTPRVYHDVRGLATGTLLEYRAVSVDAAGQVSAASTYASVGNKVSIAADSGPVEPGISSVTIAGSLQDEAGCAGDWQPGCEATMLTAGPAGVWSGTFDVPAGTYEYKAAIDGSWAINYGKNGVKDGPNITITHAGGPLTFYFDSRSNIVQSSAEGPIVTLPGSFQSEVGCPGDWQPECVGTLMADGNADGVYTFTTSAIPAGAYEGKVAHGLSWGENYGQEGIPDGANYSFSVADGETITFQYTLATHILEIISGDGGPVDPPPAPSIESVTIAGNLQAAVGCPGDWQPGCAATMLTEGPGGVWSGTFDLPAGTYEYKAAIDGAWTVNYGANGVPGGANIAITHEGGPITFYFDSRSNIVQSSAEGPIVTLPGSYQAGIGCPGDWQPDCIASLMADGDKDGVYELTTTAIPAGAYEVKVAHGLGWDENYGQDGVPGGANLAFTTADGEQVTFTYTLATHVLEITVANPPLPGTGESRAYWIDQQTLAWPAGLATGDGWTLYASSDATLDVVDGAVTGGDAFALTPVADGLTSAQLERFRALDGYVALHLDSDRGTVADLLTGELGVARASGETLTGFTGVQIAGVLDDLYADAAADADLGALPTAAGFDFRLWAPTAQAATLLAWNHGSTVAPTRFPAEWDEATGVWTVVGGADLRGVEYRWELAVYAPSTGTIVLNYVTDPYSVALTLNSERSVAIDLADPAFRPATWEDTSSPTVARAVDRAIYELHIRDFSIGDTSVPADKRGTYLAFAEEGAGRAQLRQLADAGITTVHLLPSFDLATIEEDRSAQLEPDCDLASFAPDSSEQQACVTAVADQDGFNWGYDPYHYTVPEGSYAVNPDGGTRIAEFRTMVGALHEDGLEVVLDQVFNHTAQSGQGDKSVLDKVVPGYYQRLSASGTVETSTCCQNIATENAMAGKLMVDSVVTWAKDYKVDGFRFDLMGHHSRDNMLAIRAALDELTVAEDGVDGASIYLYGEGWNFGEVANNALFDQATQGQLGGTGIGTFSDRLRDAVHGGSPVDGSSTFQQGFGTGLGTDPNGDPINGTAEESLADLAHQTDLVKLGLAGNLRAYQLTGSDGTLVRGDELDYRGAPAGYADEPDEVITYVDAHDNETLYDLSVLKLPVDTSMADRVRMNTLSLATATLGQTPSFWHAGTELLRSKSLDRNSYNSGDWFNRIDWTGQESTFGSGLPPRGDNGSKWSIMAPLLANPALKPGASDISTAEAAALDLLRVRTEVPLLRLGSADLIEQKVTFPGSGPEAAPGVIVMLIDDLVGEDVDPELAGALVVFNASPTAVTQTIPELAGRKFGLTPALAKGSDPVVKDTTWSQHTGTLNIPARTVAVLVEGQSKGSGGGNGSGNGNGGGSTGGGNGGGSTGGSNGGGITAPWATVALGSGEVAQGGVLNVDVSGLEPGQQIAATLFSEPLVAQNVPAADASGRVTFSIEIPTDFELGAHTLTIESDGYEPIDTAVTVVAAGQLASTGVALQAWLFAAVFLMVAGLLVIADRRQLV